MSRISRLLTRALPGVALNRARARAKLEAIEQARKLMRYDAATTGRRGASWHADRTNADSAAGFGRRARMAFVSRDLVRNVPLAARARDVIASNVVGDGIVPKLVTDNAALRNAALAVIEAHLDTVAIDAAGRNNLYGLQRMVMAALVTDGECLVLRHQRSLADGLAIPLQLEVLEADFLDDTRDGVLPDGGWVADGIQYARNGTRVGYWLHSEHPGALSGYSAFTASASTFWRAEDVCHVYRADRPGQQRGVSWMAPVALAIADLMDYRDAQIMKQRIAACFAAFVEHTGDVEQAKKDLGLDSGIQPGAVQFLPDNTQIKFSTPPQSAEFETFIRATQREIAAGLGVTYEALTGDLSGVNFSSARMGRMEMDRNIAGWQWTLMIPQVLQPLDLWVRQAWVQALPGRVAAIMASRFDWVPPHRIIVDPAREIPALRDAVRAGFATRQGVQRQFGVDPERILQEQIDDRKAAEKAGLVFDTDPSQVSATGVTNARPAGSEYPSEEEGENA
ncbi:MAG: phage portal protein [Pseudomonadota bacterium]